MMEYLTYCREYVLRDGSRWALIHGEFVCTMGPIINQPCSSGPVCIGGEG